jgi:3D (Asp-Asp-Asp) domain-containing protein
MQMMALCGKTLGSRRRKSVAAHAGRILIAAGFTGFILSSLLDMDIFTVKGAPGTALSADMDVQSNEVRDYRLESYLNSYLGRYADSSAALDEYSSDGLSLVAEGKKTVKATAYDLSFGSCGKRPGDPGYGITASGVKAQKGRTIAVDPEYIPLGTKVYITFPEEYAGMDGVYVAEDTGRLIKGWHIDIFFGEDKKGERKVYESAMKFGIRQVDIEILD